MHHEHYTAHLRLRVNFHDREKETVQLAYSSRLSIADQLRPLCALQRHRELLCGDRRAVLVVLLLR